MRERVRIHTEPFGTLPLSVSRSMETMYTLSAVMPPSSAATATWNWVWNSAVWGGDVGVPGCEQMQGKRSISRRGNQGRTWATVVDGQFLIVKYPCSTSVSAGGGGGLTCMDVRAVVDIQAGQHPPAPRVP